MPEARDDAREQRRRGVGPGQRGQRRERGRDDEEVVRGEVAAEGVDEEDDEVGARVEEEGAGEVGGLEKEGGKGGGGGRKKKRAGERGEQRRRSKTMKKKINRWRCSIVFSLSPSSSPGSCRCTPAAP